jgi:6-pyruvoyltetrahydropterin/6-carboxytetrahydropterin synthase
MILRITKEFTFEMAHALHEHDGFCKHLHGHTYHLSVTVKGKPMNKTGDPKNGMVADFGIIKKIIQETIVSKLDHAVLLHQDVAESVNLNTVLFSRIVTVPYTPTCENMIIDFVDSLKQKLPAELTLCKIFLRETASSYAEWLLEDN